MNIEFRSQGVIYCRPAAAFPKANKRLFTFGNAVVRKHAILYSKFNTQNSKLDTFLYPPDPLLSFLCLSLQLFYLLNLLFLCHGSPK